jgi:3-isopropylmalate dehydrogenase
VTSQNAAQPLQVGVLPGDGIGPEVTEQAVRVLLAVTAARGQKVQVVEGLLGGCAIDEKGTPLPAETREICETSAALLVGAVGGPRWDGLPAEMNPGLGGLLRLRRDFDLYANLRPGIALVRNASPLREPDVDIMLVREAVGGLYFSPERGRRVIAGEDTAWNTMHYTAGQVRRIAVVAFEQARTRRGRVASVDKANVLEASQLWRDVVTEAARDYPDVELEHLYVDNCAMQLVLRPKQFDVIVTENLFGDVLSDEIAGVVGSLGLLPSGSVRADGFGLYEPVHGAAPDIAGTGKANPVAAILSAAMLLRHSLGMAHEASLVEQAVRATLADGLMTADLDSSGRPVSTAEFGDAVLQRLAAIPPERAAG